MCSQNQLQYINDRIVNSYRYIFGNDLQKVSLKKGRVWFDLSSCLPNRSLPAGHNSLAP